MASETETPNRVKKLLSSFLSNFDQTTAENKRTICLGKNTIFTCEEDTQVPDARNRKLFYDRVESYSPLTWFAKPLYLSPLVCASYGWENVEYDMLQCVNCKAFLSGQLPKAVDTQLYKDSCNKLKKNLTTCHQKLCKWSSSPCPESFLCVPVHDQEELLSNVWFRVTSLECARIPTISYKSFEDKGVSKEMLESYAEAIRCSDEGQRKVPLDTLLCALCGWFYSESQINLLQCNLCRRNIGLWNFYTDSSCANQQLSTDCDKRNTNTSTIGTDSAIDKTSLNGIDTSCDGTNGNSKLTNGDRLFSDLGTTGNINGSNGDVKETDKVKESSEESSEPVRKRPRLEKKSFDPVAEHRYWCPWLQAESLRLNPEQSSSQGTSQTTSQSSSPVASQATSPSVSPLKSSPGSQLQYSPSQKSQEPAWLLVIKFLSHNVEDEFFKQMKQSPQAEGLRHLRKVLQQCTSPTKQSNTNKD